MNVKFTALSNGEVLYEDDEGYRLVFASWDSALMAVDYDEAIITHVRYHDAWMVED